MRLKESGLDKLAVVEFGIEAAALQQFPVGTLLDDVAVPHHQDHVRVHDGGAGGPR